MLKKLYSLMLKYNFRPKHEFDQNYIVDKNALNKVVDLINPKKDDVIFEIGGGTGNLTKELVKKSKKVIVVEKDKEMVEIIKSEINTDNLEIINKNILSLNLNEFNFNKIVGFIPYSISHKIIEKINGIKPTVLVVQKEFAEKLVAYEGFENYCAISVLTQSYNDIKINDIIKKGSFFPVPKCNSRIISLIPKSRKENKKYNEFIKGIFRYSNKNLNNAITLFEKTSKYSFDKKNIKEDILKKKVKLISVEGYIKIYNKISK